MGYKGKDSAARKADGNGMVQLWTFETREGLDRFAAILDGRGMAYEIQTKKAQVADGPDGLVIVVAASDYPEGRRLLLRHRKRRTSADRH